jgi:membrane protein YdbS with pleckstrin-like domain
VAFPRKLLNEGEELVLDLRPHPWFFAGPAALLAGSLVLLIIAKGISDWPDAIVLLLAGIVLASLVWFAGRYARWATTNFVVTSDRIIFRAGVMAKRGIEIPLERVNTIFSNQSVIERMLGSGDLLIESGGEQGRETFSDIPHPQRVQNEVYRQIEGTQTRIYGGGRPNPQSDALDQLAKLDDLRKRGAITEQEFQTKKAQLLDRM